MGDACRLRKAYLIGGGAAVVLVAVFQWTRTPVREPDVTMARYEAAVQRWQQKGPAHYQVEVDVAGPQPGHYSVTVHDRLARQAWFNGRALPTDRTVGTWSVAGMFSNIERDLAQQTRARKQGDVSDLRLVATFDPQYGYPASYRRIDWGGQPEIAWHVTNLKPIETDPPAK